MTRQLNDLQTKIIKFRDMRNWARYHQLKDLLIGLQIETAELSELFLWKNEQEIQLVDKEKIEDEIADVFVFLTYLCEHFDIDLAKAVNNKVLKNNEKYPVEKSYNSNKKYNEL